MNLLLLFFKPRWPTRIIRLDDGRQITVAELSIEAAPEVCAALDAWEDLLATAIAGKPTGGSTAIVARARAVVGAIRENNRAVGFSFPPEHSNFSISDVTQMVKAVFSGTAFEKKASASPEHSVSCEASFAQAN